MEYKKENRRKYVFGLVILLALAVATTYAWSVDTSTVLDDQTQIYLGQTVSHLSVSEYKAKPVGKNKIQISFKVTASSASTYTPDFGFTTLNAPTTDFTPATGQTLDVKKGATLSGATSLGAPTLDATTGVYTSPASSTLAASGAEYWVIEISGTGGTLYKDISSITSEQTYQGLWLVLS